MNKDVAIITLHGMGKIEEDYYVNLQNKLRKEIGTHIWDSRIHLEAIQYQTMMQPKEEQIWDTMKTFPLNNTRLRRYLLFGFADAGALEYSGHRNTSLYRTIQTIIQTALDNAFEILGRELKPVIIISQSLGCQVISNYIWDVQHNNSIFSETPKHISQTQQDFRKLKSCVYFVTSGCNIPLFVSGLAEIKCFDRPNPNFTWHNFYDKDDPLGWPLSPLSESFRNTVDLDLDINVGSLLTQWNAFSHNRYWEDKDFLEHIVRRLKLILG